MTDPSLFASGALFTQDYLGEGITGTAQFKSVDTDASREALEAIFKNFPHASGPNEATTESDLIWPVLEALGWSDYLTQQNLSAKGRVDVPDGLLFIDADAKTKANEFPDEWQRYQFGAAVIESKRWGRALDRVEARKDDGKDTPSTQLLRYLRRIDDLTNGDLRWGILTNGNKWRLYFSGARSTIDDYLELDLARIMRLDDDLLDTGVTDEDRDHWLAVFVAMFSRTAFERQTKTGPSFHDTARRDAALYEERVAASLSDLVFKRLYPELGKAVAAAAPADTELEEVRQATLILLYRLLFVLYAEDRGLLPVKDARFDDYALRDKRLDVGRRKDGGDTFSSVAENLWGHFKNLSKMIDKGDASVGLPPYNGGLFSTDQTPLLTAIGLGDDVMADAIDILSFEQRDGQRRYINYRDLSVQQLGSIYERLLEFELTRDDDGLVDIRPNIFARKNSGSYYTPDDLVLLILDETLEPLITDAMTAFQTALASRDKKRPVDQQLIRLQKHDPAKAITSLRVCDPAMGSGHFLVSLVDRLTNHALDAIAEAAVLATEAGLPDYESPIAEDIRKIRGTIQHNAEEANWTVADEQLDDPQLVKRMVLKRCVYGADKNPMAVELAKVSLWLHTFTVGAPLSFIDHHLAAGDSLFGLWVRDAIDKAEKLGGSLLWNEALKNAQRSAESMKTIEMLTDAEIAEAHRSAKMWEDVEFQTGELDGFVSFMHALDWLNLKGPDKALVNLWLDGRFGEPIPIARGKNAPDEGKAKPEEIERFTEIWTAAHALIAEERFLNWQITFPGVWENWQSAEREGGFDAVVGNPPWDRIKLQQVEWFAARRPDIAKTQRASDRKKMIASLKANGDPLHDDFLIAENRALDAARMARASGQFPLLSQGDIDIYKLFVERAQSLVNKRGMVGLLTPIGIGADNYAADFFSSLSKLKILKSFIAFENKKHWLFDDVHAEDQPTVTVFSGESRSYDSFKYAVKLHEIPDSGNSLVRELTADVLSRVNPNTSTAPILRNAADLPIIVSIYSRLPVLIDKSGDDAVAAWPVKYATMFHMTNDSHMFRTYEELQENELAWSIGGNNWESKGANWVPLFEGKSIQIDNHRYAGIRFSETGTSGQGISVHADVENWSDPEFTTQPRYWVSSSDVSPKADYHFALNGICNSNNERTLISALIPDVG